MHFDLSPYIRQLRSIGAKTPDLSRVVVRNLGPKRGLLMATATFALFVPVLVACVVASEIERQFFYAQSIGGTDDRTGPNAKLDSGLAQVASNAEIVDSPSPEIATQTPLSPPLPLPRVRPQASASHSARLQHRTRLSLAVVEKE
jgi:hypothetical protein